MSRAPSRCEDEASVDRARRLGGHACGRAVYLDLGAERGCTGIRRARRDEHRRLSHQPNRLHDDAVAGAEPPPSGTGQGLRAQPPRCASSSDLPAKRCLMGWAVPDPSSRGEDQLWLFETARRASAERRLALRERLRVHRRRLGVAGDGAGPPQTSHRGRLASKTYCPGGTQHPAHGPCPRPGSADDVATDPVRLIRCHRVARTHVLVIALITAR